MRRNASTKTVLEYVGHAPAFSRLEMTRLSNGEVRFYGYESGVYTADQVKTIAAWLIEAGAAAKGE